MTDAINHLKKVDFFSGLGSIFNIAPKTNYQQLIGLDVSEEDRLRQTWERVGSHLYSGIRLYENEQKINPSLAWKESKPAKN